METFVTIAHWRPNAAYAEFFKKAERSCQMTSGLSLMSKPDPKTPKVRCRTIEDADHPAVAALLARGFPGRSEAYWLRGLRRQQERELPPDVPRYGYLLESRGEVCGALLLIYANRHFGSEPFLQCNLSSWFVDPVFRSYASLLTSIAQKDRTTTFVNLTAARNTWPIIEAQGFRPSCHGVFFSCPVLSHGGGAIEVVQPSTSSVAGLPEEDFERLRRHASLGCLSLVCRTVDGPQPFILMPYRIRNGRVPLPAMHLIYARSLDDYRSCAGALGRFLLKRGRLFVLLGADGPVDGLAGVYTDRRGRRYVRGPHPPGLCDLTDSELVLFVA